jgi:hypothetical protein
MEGCSEAAVVVNNSNKQLARARSADSRVHMYRRHPVSKLQVGPNSAVPPAPQQSQSAATAVGRSGGGDMEGLGHGNGDSLELDPDFVDDAGDLFLRDASGNERR